MAGVVPPQITGEKYGGLGNSIVVTDDPAFQPPQDPTRDIPGMRARAEVITREIPNVTVQQGWGIADVRDAIVDLSSGLFDQPAQLLDAIAGDSRVQSAMRSRSGGLLGRPIKFKIPDRYKKDPQAKKCLRIWENHWPRMEAEPALLDMLETSHCMGFSYSQILWDTGREIWRPYLQTYNTRFSYYHWLYRLHVGITLDGSIPITPGDGHWVLHAPYGSYRGWMRGALRAVAQWWLARSYALRDWARYCEKHGFPLLINDVPFGADPQAITDLRVQLATIGQESILSVPGSVDINKYGKYDLRYLEPKDQGWESFKGLIEQCNDEITLALMGQNLTSQVKEGSFAAARVHADVRQDILEADARALSRTIYTQVARPFAAMNFGNAEFAPLVTWDVRPVEDQKAKADTFQAFCTGLAQMRAAGFQLKDAHKFARRFGLAGMDLEAVAPVQVEARVASVTGQADDADSKTKNDKSDAKPKLQAFARKLAAVNERAGQRSTFVTAAV
jgi:hypothetical protein